jgi:predicted DsbA family dithiol-disulfide isomerase
MVKATYYLEVISSWCHWAEPAWAELKARFSDRVEFEWKIALMPPEAYPVSVNQCQWFYRRSGTIMQSPYMLSPDWLEPEIKQYRATNLVALAAKEMGVADDRARLAIAHSAVREGRKVGRWEVSVEEAANACKLDRSKLLSLAQSPELAAIADTTTAEFAALKVSQRPTFLFENAIGDRCVFSGLVRVEPLEAAIEALLADEAAYQSWKAHVGEAPPR